MKYFIKICTLLLAFFFLCSPLSAADDMGNDSPEFLQVRDYTYIPARELWKIELSDGKVMELQLPPEATKGLLQKIEEEKERTRHESELPRDQDYARDIGGLAKIFAQMVLPFGVPLTTGTGLLAERYLGTPTLTEGALKIVRPIKPTTPVFKGAKKVRNLKGTHRIINRDLRKPQNLRNLHKGQLAFTPPKKEGDTYVEFLMGEDQSSQESMDALWEICVVDVEVEGKDERESHYIIKHANSGHLLTFTKAMLGRPWSGYYCSVQPRPETIDQNFLWDIYYNTENKVHLLRNIGCYPGLLCYTKNESSRGHPYGQVLVQSLVSQFNVEEYYLEGLHRSSIEFVLPRYINYSQQVLQPPMALSSSLENPPNDAFQSISFDEEGYVSPDEEEKKEGYSLLEDDDFDGFFDAPLTFQAGIYQIRNCDLSSLEKNPNRNPNVGLLLPIMTKPSQSGYYVGFLNPQFSDLKISDHQDLWEICNAEGGYYTIRNYASPDAGWLTWTDKGTYSGFYGQMLGDNKSLFFNSFPKEIRDYEPGGKFRDDILWEITEEYDRGTLNCILRNKGNKFKSDEGGAVCYTNDLSPIGPYMQVLHSSTKYFQQDREKYKPDGEFRSSILLRLSATTPPKPSHQTLEDEFEDLLKVEE